MQAAGFRLGIDFGTSHTVAVLRWPDGRVRPLLFDGSPMLPSAVYLDAAGRLIVGRDALDSGRLHPSRLEPNPKRRIDDGSVLLADQPIAVVDLVAAVLAVVGTEAVRTAGERPVVVTLTCPAAWGTPRRRILLDAAVRAGLGDVRMVEEPVAAATYFAQVLGYRMPAGDGVVVYDLGGGTFDVSLVERTAGGFRTRAVDGRDDIGGLDLDEALIRRLGAVYGPLDPVGWRRLIEPASAQEHRQRRLFRDDVRAVKERLSRYPTADLHLPGLDREAHITREELEELARPLLDQTVALTMRVAGHAGFPRQRLTGVFLVGGGSRIPLVNTLIHRGLAITPTMLEQPELVVAEGSILVHSVVAVAREPGRMVDPPPIPVSPAVPQAPASPPVPGGRPRSRWAKPAGVAALAILATIVAVVVFVVSTRDRSGGTRTDGLPAVCALASPATGTTALAPGSPAPAPGFAVPEGWQPYLDASGFRIGFPAQWARFGTDPCFGDRGESRYVAVGQWRQPDTDLVGYWTRKESQVASALSGYRKVGIQARPNYFDGAADWEFTFDDGDETIHVRAVALVSGTRGYTYLWATKESIWEISLADFSRVSATFRPAR